MASKTSHLSSDVEEDQTIHGVFIVRNDRGLHTRPATELVKCSSKFRSHITLNYKGMEVNGKSLLGILVLAAEYGAKIEVIATGTDADEVVRCILNLARQDFYMNF